jgi:hypothetical protein
MPIEAGVPEIPPGLVLSRKPGSLISKVRQNVKRLDRKGLGNI